VAELEVSAKKMLLNFSVSWMKLLIKITWMLVRYLMWMKLPFPLPKNHKVLARMGEHQTGSNDKCRERNRHNLYVLHGFCGDVFSIIAYVSEVTLQV
jgi:hypothetical protein